MIERIRNFDEATEKILEFMSRVISINTLFIAKNDKCVNEIEKVFNRENALLKKGDKLPFPETFCKLSVDYGNRILVIEDINNNELTRNMAITCQLGGGSFIGIPINYGTGENYGTICGLGDKHFEFKEEHLELFTTMSSLLSYVLDLDRVNKEVEELSAPIVPLTDEIAVLPIIGNISMTRAEAIIQSTLQNSFLRSLNYLIIDLSGMVQINEDVSHYFLKLVNMLKLIGVSAILTGIHPGLAQKMVEGNFLLNGNTIKKSLRAALEYIGFTLVAKSEI